MDRYDEEMFDELGFDEAEGAADSYDEMDGIDEADGMDEADEADEMDEGDSYDEMDEADEYDEMDEGDSYDEMDAGRRVRRGVGPCACPRTWCRG